MGVKTSPPNFGHLVDLLDMELDLDIQFGHDVLRWKFLEVRNVKFLAIFRKNPKMVGLALFHNPESWHMRHDYLCNSL